MFQGTYRKSKSSCRVKGEYINLESWSKEEKSQPGNRNEEKEIEAGIQRN